MTHIAPGTNSGHPPGEQDCPGRSQLLEWDFDILRLVFLVLESDGDAYGVRSRL